MNDAGVEFEHRAGGVKIVFDVPASEQGAAVTTFRESGFDVQPYYPAGRPARRGGAPAGHVRWGAERPLTGPVGPACKQAERDFAALNGAAGSRWRLVGVDAWTAGGGSGPAGVREPRRPLPRAGSGAAAVEA